MVMTSRSNSNNVKDNISTKFLEQSTEAEYLETCRDSYECIRLWIL